MNANASEEPIAKAARTDNLLQILILTILHPESECGLVQVK